MSSLLLSTVSRCTSRVPLPPLFTAAFMVVVMLVWFPALSLAQQADAEVLVAEGILSFDAKQFDEARAFFARAISLDPRHARAYYYLARCHLAQGKPDLAIAPLTTLHQLRPNDLDATHQLGIAHFSLRADEKATPLLEEVFQREPSRADLGFSVGVLRYRNKNYDGAAAALAANRSSDPDIQQLAMFYRGLSLGILGLSDQAQAELISAQRVQPNSPITGATVRIQEALTAASTRIPDAQRLHLQLAIGGYCDDNVAVNPRRSRDLVAEILRSRTTQSPGFVTSARGDYSWYRHGPIESTVAYSYYQTVNTNSGVGAFNIQDHLGALSGVYRGTVGSIPYEIGGQYSYDYMLLGLKGFLSRHTLTFPAAFVPPAVTLPALGCQHR